MKNVREEYINLTDLVTYSQLYGPDYPIEDRTNFRIELHKITNCLEQLFSTEEEEHVLAHLNRAKDVISQAFKSFETGCEAFELLENALLEIRQSKHPPKKTNADFRIAEDGALRKEP